MERRGTDKLFKEFILLRRVSKMKMADLFLPQSVFSHIKSYLSACIELHFDILSLN